MTNTIAQPRADLAAIVAALVQRVEALEQGQDALDRGLVETGTTASRALATANEADAKLDHLDQALVIVGRAAGAPGRDLLSAMHRQRRSRLSVVDSARIDELERAMQERDAELDAIQAVMKRAVDQAGLGEAAPPRQRDRHGLHTVGPHTPSAS